MMPPFNNPTFYITLCVLAVWMVYPLFLSMFGNKSATTNVPSTGADLGHSVTDDRYYSGAGATFAVVMNVLAALIVYYTCVHLTSGHQPYSGYHARSLYFAYVTWVLIAIRVSAAIRQLNKRIPMSNFPAALLLPFWLLVGSVALFPFMPISG